MLLTTQTLSFGFGLLVCWFVGLLVCWFVFVLWCAVCTGGCDCGAVAAALCRLRSSSFFLFVDATYIDAVRLWAQGLCDLYSCTKRQVGALAVPLQCVS